MIDYTNNLDRINDGMLHGFFVGWPNPPSASLHMQILQGSYLVWLAIDTDSNRVIGFINAISDGILSAYIPLLEVLPEYQNKGIGKELVIRMLDSLKGFYMVDLLCDEHFQPFYTNLGMRKATGSLIRNHSCLMKKN